jgi:hypothetical protein
MDFCASNIATIEVLMLVTHSALAGDGLGVDTNALVDGVVGSSVVAWIQAGACVIPGLPKNLFWQMLAWCPTLEQWLQTSHL